MTKDRAIFYCELHEEVELARVLAVFFGGQDHRPSMLARFGPCVSGVRSRRRMRQAA